MKNTVLLLGLLLIVISMSGQTTAAEQIAAKIAQKMKDTLNLNELQRTTVYNVNMQLHNQKQMVRQQFQHADSIGRHLQLVERRRDTLYFPLLTPAQYQLYKQKKRFLVSAN